MWRQTAHSDLSQLEKMLQVKTFAEVEMSESAPAQLVDLGGRSVEVWQNKVEYKSDQTLGNFIPGIPIPHQLTEHCDQWG